MQAVSNELLISLDKYASTLSDSKVILFPQLLWSMVALLTSNVETEFIRAARMLHKLLTRINFEDENVGHVLLSKVRPIPFPLHIGC